MAYRVALPKNKENFSQKGESSDSLPLLKISGNSGNSGNSPALELANTIPEEPLETTKPQADPISDEVDEIVAVWRRVRRFSVSREHIAKNLRQIRDWQNPPRYQLDGGKARQ